MRYPKYSELRLCFALCLIFIEVLVLFCSWRKIIKIQIMIVFYVAKDVLQTTYYFVMKHNIILLFSQINVANWYET